MTPRSAFAPVAVPDEAVAPPSGSAVILDASDGAPARTLPATTPAGSRTFAPEGAERPSPGEQPAGEVRPEAAGTDDDAPAEQPAVEHPGYVVVEVDGRRWAVGVDEVHEILRLPALEPLADAGPGGVVALVDVRGRSIPVLDRRRTRGGSVQVLLPVFRHQVGLVVDRVLAVRADLEAELDSTSSVLPAPALGVLRPVDGGAPVLLMSLPRAETVTQS